MSKIVFVCSKCGGENVFADAFCSWNVDEQEWEIASTFEKGAVCDDCDGPCRLETRELIAATDKD